MDNKEKVKKILGEAEFDGRCIILDNEDELIEMFSQLFEPKPDDRLLKYEEIGDAIKRDESKGFPTHPFTQIIKEAQDAKTASIKDAENKELGLLLKSKVGGIHETNDWSEQGLRLFREQVLPVIREHCQELAKGDLGILHKYLDEKEDETEMLKEEIHKADQARIDFMFQASSDVERVKAECQQKVERIFGEIESHIVFDNITTDDIILADWWQALKKQKGVKE